jgi:Type II secretion system (T2SS), protein M
MKTSDRQILAGIGLVGLVAVFWFLVIAPKREEASKLNTEVTELRATVEQTEADATAGEQAQKDFPTNYRRLVALGKAVPADADTPSLLRQVQALSERSNVDFRSINLESSGGGTTPAAPAPTTPAPPAPAEGDTSTTDTASTDTAATDATATAPASEASAALLPIGATVGTAGLPVMPYTLEFEGGFFDIADFFGQLDGMVRANNQKVAVTGRLLTIDGFELAPGPSGFPDLTATVATTSYLTPSDQGLAAGATPSAPAPVADPAAAVPPADTSSTAVPTATATP